MKILQLFFIFLSHFLIAQSTPNILWVVCEDISPTLSMYGDSTAKTPHLDALARESIIYKNAFTTVGVCAPSRSAIITGMHPTSLGTMHMRTGKDIMSWGRREYKKSIPITDIAGDPIREYAVVPPSEVKCFTEYLRAAGYFCTNNQKTDYQFAAPVTAWDENGPNAHWRNRPDGRPFFSVFNIGLTHESRLWVHKDLPLTVKPEEVVVPPYLPDTELSRIDIARHYSNVELMDEQVDKILAALKADGLYDNTIIFFYSDHGGPLPRQKREIYDSGLRVPFMIKGLNGKQKGYTERLISFVDLAPTVLSLAGIKPPDYMEGLAFSGNYAASERTHLFGSSDRFDEFTDRSRMVRDKQFLYVRNFFPELPKYKDLSYRKKIPMMGDMLELKAQGRLNILQQQWFDTKVTEELYDCIADPHNLNNLAIDPTYHLELEHMRGLLLQHMSEAPDLGLIPEATLIDMMWPDGEQPQTALPLVQQKQQSLQIKCSTPGSSIAYLILDAPQQNPDLNDGWQIYHQSFESIPGKYLYVIAERLGYATSEMVVLQME
ncbi:MAG: hypothetical protein DHS20C18_29540 [Saprospiraceae bacterium]|nr:MAG: hypothetical protein DHS20C18_29540 [Saprospiraceae bacterium]